MDNDPRYNLDPDFFHFHLYYKRDVLEKYLSSVIQLLPDGDWTLEISEEDDYYTGTICSENLCVALYPCCHIYWGCTPYGLGWDGDNWFEVTSKNIILTLDVFTNHRQS